MIRTRIVVPCYNEEHRLTPEAFSAYLAANEGVGFVMVNDGSTDGTLGVLEALAARFPDRIRIVDRQPNAGKAEAVRAGLLLAIQLDSQYVGYWDADLATPLVAIRHFVDVLDRRSDIDFVLGSRVKLLGRRINRRPIRHYLGRAFATAASLVLSLPVYDTQCGAKLMRVSSGIGACLASPFGSRWIFDVELIARFLSGGRSATALYELPLDHWEDVGESKVRRSDFLRAAAELAAIYRIYRIPQRYRKLFDAVTAPFVRYVGAGSIGTSAHYLVLVLAVEVLQVRAPVAATAGASFGALVNYFLNYHVTFASKAPHRSTLPRFLAVAALGVGLTTLGMLLLREKLQMHYLPAQILCTVLVLAVGYLLNRAWTFARPESAHTPPR